MDGLLLGGVSRAFCFCLERWFLKAGLQGQLKQVMQVYEWP